MKLQRSAIKNPNDYMWTCTAIVLSLIIQCSSLEVGSFYKSMKWAHQIGCSVHEVFNFSRGPSSTPLSPFRDNSHEHSFELNMSSPIHTIFKRKYEQRLELPFLIDLQEGMSVEESLYLIYLNMANGLQTGSNELPVFPEIEWKKHVMNTIAKIVTTVCPTQYVPLEYIHVVKELFLHYQTHLYAQTRQEFAINTTSAESPTSKAKLQWNNIQSVLTECLSFAKKLELKEKGTSGLISELRVNNTAFGLAKIMVMGEDADTDARFRQKDDIIEGAWWSFSLVYGYCYHIFNTQNGLDTSSTGSDANTTEFLELFHQEFLANLKKRWLDAGKYSKSFGTIFGKFNNTLVKRNLRYCVTAAYMQSGIEDLQLVRPFAFRFENARTGTSIS